MTTNARILVAERVKTDAKGLHAKLAAEGCDVTSVEAIDMVRQLTGAGRPDVIVVDVTALPARNPEAVASLRAEARSHHIPLIVVGRAGEQSPLTGGDPTGLEDFVAKPLQGVELAARVHALRRLGVMQAELARRVETARKFGFSSVPQPSMTEGPDRLRVLAVDPSDADITALRKALGRSGWVEVASGLDAVESLLDARHDAAVVFAGETNLEALEVCAAVRRAPNLFHFPILLVTTFESVEDPSAPIRAGVNDVIARPVAAAELRERVIALVRLERFRSALLQAYRQGLGLIVTDGLTGLFRFGFLHEHLNQTIKGLATSGGSLAVAAIQIADLADINRRSGHAAGDRVIRQVGAVISRLIRSEDLAARVGGATFAIAMPDTSRSAARVVCQRIAAVVANTDSGLVHGGVSLPCRVATGCTMANPEDTAEDLIARAVATPP